MNIENKNEPIFIGTASELEQDNLRELSIEELLALAEKQEENEDVNPEGND